MIEEVYKAKTLEETLKLLDTKSDSMIIAGGTDLIVQMRNKRLQKKNLIDISDVEELKLISEDKGIIKIGACTTFNQIIHNETLNRNLDGLKKAAMSVGSPQIRSRGTIGGNICNNSPSADLILPLLVLDAVVTIQTKSYERKVHLKNLLLDKNKVDIKDNEILTYIEFEKPTKDQIVTFSKLGFRKSLAIAKVSAGVFLDIKDNKFEIVRISLGALSNIARRAYNVEDYLIGKEVKDEYINIAIDMLENNVKKELQGRESAEFKSHAVKGVVESAISECIKLNLRG
ncbi:FAD binding domain-containing protein [Romboutsia lituseburensis]|uniref:FAD binding domain-containing protein n=1 Tax=Romboutsia lituseburensis TaxID=1537 RepID=UPI00215B4080|nr:xanthine dehydrogenase family protein subunit M [Romboutsia lituseburensis]MCR8744537.1 xanthine dehydrogenase family protein subunit M [Romboutsia lituseburensis]